MELRCVLKSKKNLHSAVGIYDTDTKRIIVLKGSKINPQQSYPKMIASVVALRKDRQLVDEKGILLSDIPFSTVSSAAQFITGRSSNGYIAWRPDDKMSLKEYIAQH